jgi:hypothetical protein
MPELRGFRDPFNSTISQFNNFSDPRALSESFVGALQLGDSFFTAANTSGWGVPLFEEAYGASVELVIKARDFLNQALNGLQQAIFVGGDLIESALQVAGDVLKNVIGPVLDAITGVIPIIGQIVQAVKFVYRAVKRLLKWLNRTDYDPQPPAPLERPVYSAAADLNRTRSTLGAMAARVTGASPRMTSFFSPPVWSEDLLDPDYTDVVLKIKDLGIWGLLEVAQLNDGTKVVRQRWVPTTWNWGTAAWGTGFQTYDASFPSLVPGSGIGTGNPGRVHTGMLVLSESNGQIQVTDLAARFPEYAMTPGPMMGQISRYGPALYSLHAQALRSRWPPYLSNWYFGLARASGQKTWAEHAGVPMAGSAQNWFDQPSPLAITNQWQNTLTPREAWAIRAYFGQVFSTPETPKSNAGPYPELGMGIAEFGWRDALLHPETAIPCVAMSDLFERQELCLHHGATPLYLQPDDDALSGSAKIGPDAQLTIREKWNERIDQLGTFATQKDAGIICSPALEESMVVDPQVQQMIADKRLGAGVGSLAACTVWKMTSFQIQNDPATPAQPGAMLQVGDTEIPDDDEETGGGGGGGMALAAVGILAAALALSRKK